VFELLSQNNTRGKEGWSTKCHMTFTPYFEQFFPIFNCLLLRKAFILKNEKSVTSREGRGFVGERESKIGQQSVTNYLNGL
jgi:hypothetical protein